jgi:prophage maintenance system killer protein
VDGNKRLAAGLLVATYGINGYRFEAVPRHLATGIRAVARNRCGDDDGVAIRGIAMVLAGWAQDVSHLVPDEDE